jgi:fumarylpyruvate hydrolase
MFPVRRVFCVGRNYAEHAIEMGSDPTREPPFYFTKPADAVVVLDADMPYPPRTSSCTTRWNWSSPSARPARTSPCRRR